MNRSKIEWCDHTLNIITGCLHDCPYCYARTMAKRFSGNVKQNILSGQGVQIENGCFELYQPFVDEAGQAVVYPFGFAPTFHKYRLGILDKHKSGKNIFVGAMADMFGKWVPDAWLTDIFDVCTQHKLNNYLFLTKNPARYQTTTLPAGEHFWYGTTITGNADLHRIGLLPRQRKTFLSIEPLLERIFIPLEDLKGVHWVILGAETGRRKGKVRPESDWVKMIVLQADVAGIPVFMKESMVPIVGEKNMLREFPRQLQGHARSEKVKKRLENTCIRCSRQMDKKEMVAISAKVARGLPGKTLFDICRDCYDEWCNEMGIEGFTGFLYGEEENNG